MRINHNIAALNTHRQLQQANNANQGSMEKLSSGLRINRAGDDAAGLAISEKMRGQIRGLEQAERNAQDGISMIQTAEGALNESHSILQRMRELAVQSSNETNTDADRQEIQKEVTQLKSEINRISDDTEFNSKKLLNGDIGLRMSSNTNGAKFNVDESQAVESNLDSGQYDVTVSSLSSSATVSQAAAGVSDGDIEIASGTGSLEAGDYTLEISGPASSASYFVKDTNGNTVASGSGNISSGGSDLSAGAVTLSAGKYTELASQETADIEFSVAYEADISVTDPSGSVNTYSGTKTDSESEFNVGGFELNVDSSTQTGTSKLDVTNDAVSFQIGANEDQTTKLAVNNMDTTSLGVDAIDVTTQSGAESAITSINDAIQDVSGERSKLGAIQNRLEHTINNLGTSSENLTAAESRIRDVDMAKEMMNQTKQNILAQASQSMLAKANQQPQGVLQLLR